MKRQLRFLAEDIRHALMMRLREGGLIHPREANYPGLIWGFVLLCSPSILRLLNPHHQRPQPLLRWDVQHGQGGVVERGDQSQDPFVAQPHAADAQRSQAVDDGPAAAVQLGQCLLVRLPQQAGDGVRQGDEVGRHLRVDLHGHPLDPAGQLGQVTGPLLAGS